MTIADRVQVFPEQLDNITESFCSLLDFHTCQTFSWTYGEACYRFFSPVEGANIVWKTLSINPPFAKRSI